MLFNSIEFAFFLPIVFFIYWFLYKNKTKYQNILIVVTSYVFYGWWDWRFLSLIAFSTCVDYLIGVSLGGQNNERKRKVFLYVSVLVNLGFLGVFKYYNFFIDNFMSAFTFFGTKINVTSLNIILPVGISFYTFQTLSYTIDVYKHNLKPTKDFIAFSAFVSFFPQLVAGPIERATNLLPQFYEKRKFEYTKAVDGLRQILWGLFKKIVIADNAAVVANQIFNSSSEYSGSTLILGAFFFTFQIYGDFSGYSDIAIGTSRLLGFDLKQNFSFPYFSRDIAEFWRRWHISLSTWFRDYVYIPLGGSRGSTWAKTRNIFVIFLVSGFWHGANWTFIVWGALNAFYFLPLMFLNKNRVNTDIVAKGKSIPSFKEVMSMSLTFSLTVVAWIFFRANNLDQAITYINEIFSMSTFSMPYYSGMLTPMLLIIFFMIIEWFGRENKYAIEKLFFRYNFSIRWITYLVFIIMIFLNNNESQQFIYFQF
ncbi:MBOAT family O-acyltransferase [Flavivirga abyssicola]|uniref:MBOAT family O-acyltransferase n=1 Tax=Flavivirga abyssicola TaxID=3063533 RepID=UPI0026E0FD02|nr:MBOAT family O-acyltransferase [Flavivirga sp. MEBiC07777]WVK14797.1 MBOAT family O-acyltransferase [Flavivirga sp. MEBiC07777]